MNMILSRQGRKERQEKRVDRSKKLGVLGGLNNFLLDILNPDNHETG
jgi:hypothetical protein